MRNDLRVDRMFLALDAVTGPNGTPICRVQQFDLPMQIWRRRLRARRTSSAIPCNHLVGLDSTISGCVPLNPFGQGNVSRRRATHLVGDKWGKSDVPSEVRRGAAHRQVVDGWAGPISSAFGVTYRKESLIQEPFPTRSRALGPPLNAPQLGIAAFRVGFRGPQPEPDPVLHG